MTPIKPAFKNNNIGIVLCTDDNYSKYCAVSVQSIIANADSKNNYDIIIFDGGIKENSKKLLNSMVDNLKNFSIRYVNMEKLLKDFDTSVFFVDQWFSMAAYYRLFIPKVLKDYKKVMYMDCDIVLNSDIAKVFKTSLNGKIAGVITEAVIEYLINLNSENKRFYIDTLGVKTPQKYFNSGFMLLNVEKMQKKNSLQQLIDANKVFRPRHVDQDLFNYVFKNDVKFLDMKYNFMVGLLSARIDFVHLLSENTFFKYMKSMREAQVIHYTGPIKPWHKKDLIYHDLWWVYAKNTPFSDLINKEYNDHIQNLIDTESTKQAIQNAGNICTKKETGILKLFKLTNKPNCFKLKFIGLKILEYKTNNKGITTIKLFYIPILKKSTQKV